MSKKNKFQPNPTEEMINGAYCIEGSVVMLRQQVLELRDA